MTRLDFLHERLRPLKSALLDHPLYRHIDDVQALHLFLEYHVFAVWDFMSLLKTLQRHFSCVATPWLPPVHPLACRLVNEIVLAEESDDDGQGGFASHFELYRRAMTRCGASTTAIDGFLHGIRQGQTVPDTLEAMSIPDFVQGFVRQTFAVIASGDLCAIAAAFTFGREELLPAMFRRVVDRLNVEMAGHLEDFRFYLNRHIGLDEGEHGPMAQRLVTLLCGADESRWLAAEQAAVRSLEARQGLWDGILGEIQGRRGGSRSTTSTHHGILPTS